MNELYQNLMNLTVAGDYTKFFYKDFQTPLGTQVRIFTYNYASYEDWLKDGALESRGIMFELDADEQPVRIMARPMEKFFNLNENPFTMGLDLSTIDYYMFKADGSLVSSYVDQGRVYFKSKASIYSDQAVRSTQLLNGQQNEKLRARVKELDEQGFTCNFEYCAPDNQIVLYYDTPTLILLNVRDKETGEYVHDDELYRDVVLRPYLVGTLRIDPERFNQEDFIAETYAAEGIEGYVLRLKSGQHVKMKTEWYVALHNIRGSLQNNQQLFDVCVNNGTDDLRALFEDPESRARIDAFERSFLDNYKANVDYLHSLYLKLKDKSRKDYAIESQVKLREDDKFYLFGTFMTMFDGRVTLSDLIDVMPSVLNKNWERFVPEKYKVQNVQD